MFQQPTGWAHRTLQRVKEVTEKGEYVFITSCVMSTTERIEAMTEIAKETSYEAMAAECDLSGFEITLGYGEDTGMLLENDRCVRFYSSTYCGAKCYYLDHSCIEYIWVSAEEADWVLRQHE